MTIPTIITAHAVLFGLILPVNTNTLKKPAGFDTFKIEPKVYQTIPQTDLQPLEQAPMPEVVQTTTPSPEPAQNVSMDVTSNIPDACGDNEYAHFIYMHESGCNPSALNSSGCRGIGQACPGDKLPCGADYVCQNEYFSSYALNKYGSWQAAFTFWQANSWW